jgi:hypothetical protein
MVGALRHPIRRCRPAELIGAARGAARRLLSGRDVGVPDSDPVLAIAEHLVRHDQRAHGADEGERRKRGDRDRSRDEQRDRPDRPPPEEFARAPEDIRRCIQWLPIGVEVRLAA